MTAGSVPRCGIASGGNWIVDRVKMVDRFPGRGMLANIASESRGTGGASANVLMDLARMSFPHPLVGIGIVGEDDDGAFVLDQCRRLRIDASGLHTTREAPTSYTDVMTEQASGDRSFFHQRGANALFGPEHVQCETLRCRIFHLGYLLLLDRMDQTDPVHGTVAAGFLQTLRSLGIRTSLDVVSEESDRFRLLVPPALRHVDYLILNEIEAGRSVARSVRGADGRLDAPALVDAVDALYEFGSMDLVAVHMAEGVYLRDRAGRRHARGSRLLPPGFIRSAVGAGDAFCAGMLYGLHEGWDHAVSAHLGICCATACLSDARATDGVVSREECIALAERFPERKPPVPV